MIAITKGFGGNEFGLNVNVPGAGVCHERNVRVEVETGNQPSVNVCSSAPISPEGARALAKMLLLAADIAEGTILLPSI